jgi:hypothetical protein
MVYTLLYYRELSEEDLGEYIVLLDGEPNEHSREDGPPNPQRKAAIAKEWCKPGYFLHSVYSVTSCREQNQICLPTDRELRSSKADQGERT